MSTQSTSVCAALVFSGVFQEPPFWPKPRVRIASGGTFWAWAVPKTWMAGHLSRLPRTSGCCPLAFSVARLASNSAQVSGSSTPAALSFAVLTKTPTTYPTWGRPKRLTLPKVLPSVEYEEYLRTDSG